MTESESDQNILFDYRALRLLLGSIMFALPLLVIWISSTPLPSISASYYTEARDVFVGSLFIVAALLAAYNGRTIHEEVISNIGAVAAICVALSPTSCDGCPNDTKAIVHYAAAVVLFSVTVYFCFVPFQRKKPDELAKRSIRKIIYWVCGSLIIVSMVSIGAAEFALSEVTMKSLAVTFWGEFLALWAFGVAWIVASKVLPFIVDEDERYRPSFKLR